MRKRQLTGILYFYQKLIVPSAAVSLLLALLSLPYTDLGVGTGIACMIVTPAFHYFTYEVRNPGEYLYYLNLGISRGTLWVSTLCLSLLPGIIAIAL